MTNKIKAILELTKIRITVSVSLTTIAGYVLANNGFSQHMIFPVFGIFLLACSSSVINHIQESNYDKKMKRTIHRPIPSGTISIRAALLLSIILTISGIFILYNYSTLWALLLGLMALIWYNFIYTPLKRFTAFAVIPGAFVGAIPPIAGWAAAGGELLKIQVLFLALFFFFWQIPHSVLLLVKYQSEYKKAGFPVLTSILPLNGVFWFIWIWVLLTAVSSVSLIFIGVFQSFISISGNILISLIISISFTVPIIRTPSEFQPNKLFILINIYVLIMILLMTFDHLLK